jgi:hypothetical protein
MSEVVSMCKACPCMAQNQRSVARILTQLQVTAMLSHPWIVEYIWVTAPRWECIREKGSQSTFNCSSVLFTRAHIAVRFSARRSTLGMCWFCSTFNSCLLSLCWILSMDWLLWRARLSAFLWAELSCAAPWRRRKAAPVCLPFQPTNLLPGKGQSLAPYFPGVHLFNINMPAASSTVWTQTWHMRIDSICMCHDCVWHSIVVTASSAFIACLCFQ